MHIHLLLKDEKEWESAAEEAQYHPGKLARQCKVSLKTLERYFKEHKKLPPGKWLRERRWTKVESLLVSGQHTHQEIAQKLGINSESQFYHQVHSRTGMSPNEYVTKKMSEQKVAENTRAKFLK